VSQPQVYANIALSPDGKAAVFDKTDEENQNTDVWFYDFQLDSAKRLTFDTAIDTTPLFSPDGKRVLFASSREHSFKLFVKNADGADEEKVLDIDAGDRADHYPCDWSRDGKYILYKRATELWIAEMPSLKARPFVQGRGSVKNGQFSPDDKWVSYASNETGRWEIYVTSFPDGRGKWQVSNAGGTQPRWRGDGKEIFYLAPDGTMMAVPVTGGANFNSGVPVALFQANSREQIATSEQVTYDVAKDGQRFLINTQIRDSAGQPMTVILNWAAGLKK